MSKRIRADDLDLLAYADGLLDGDRAAREEVEGALRSSPEEMERARAFRRQTEDLRSAYAGRAAEPVPERLRAVLDPRPSTAPATALKAAAALVLALGTGVGGWWVGSRDDDGWSAAEFVEDSYAQFTAAGAAAPQVETSAAGPGAATGAPTAAEFSVRLAAPDLSEMGYGLVDRRSVPTGGAEMIRLDYAAADGRAFSLFMAPRWEMPRSGITQAERNGVSLAHWLEGPLAATVITRMPPAETHRLAESLRHRIGSDGSAVVKAEAATPRPQENVLADTLPALQLSDPPALDAREDGG